MTSAAGGHLWTRIHAIVPKDGLRGRAAAGDADSGWRVELPIQGGEFFSARVAELAAAPCERRTRSEAEHEHERDQDERGSPRLLVQRRVRRLRVLEDRERDRRHRLAHVGRDRRRRDRRREEERRRLAGGAGDRERRTGRDPSDGGRKDDAEDGPPAARAEREARLAQVARDELEHLLRGARDERQHDHRQRDRPRERTLVVADDQQREDEDPDHDRRDAVQHVECEPHAPVDRGRRELGHVDRDENADRNRHRRRHRDQQGAADDRLRDPAAGLAEGHGRRGQELPRERVDSLQQHLADDECDHRDRRERGDRRERLGGAVCELAPPRAADRRERRCRHQSPPTRWNSKRFTTSCAPKFVTSEITSRIAARYTIAATWRSDAAPWYCAAIRLASVSPVANTDVWIPVWPPITCVTAIASPMARPRPRTIAATTPPFVYWRTTSRTISHRVAPRAIAPSSRSSGTLRKSSRQIEEVIGTIMIVSTRIAVSCPLPFCVGSPAKIGIQPKWSATKGPRTRIPHSPRTTEGIAASISTSEPMTPRIPRGASSLR